MSTPQLAADLAKLHARLARLAEEYQARRAVAHALVKRWEWYTDEAFDLRPLSYERDLRGPGRRLARRPPAHTDHCRIGFDEDDRLVVCEEYNGFLAGALYYQTFRDYHTDGARVYQSHYYADGRPIYLHEYRYEGGLIRAALMAGGQNREAEIYHYTGDKVTRIDVIRAPLAHGSPARRNPPVPVAAITAGYDAHGITRLEIEHITGRGPATELVYARPPSGFSLDDACGAIQLELLTSIPEAVRELEIDEPAYCVALAYMPGEPIRATLHVGVDRGRREWMAQLHATEGDTPWPEEVWSPGDMDYDCDIRLERIADLVRLVRQELTLADADEPLAARGSQRDRSLLCAVAAELNTRAWADVLPVTDDFLVYAVDYELIDLDDNLRACMPPRTGSAVGGNR
jgi:hypothetical protein